MKLEIKIWKKGQGPFCQFDADRNGRFTFETIVDDFPQALKLNLLRPNKPYTMTIDVPELKANLSLNKKGGKKK